MIFTASPQVFLFLGMFFLLASRLLGSEARAHENPFPLLPGLEGAVEFWKLVFTQYDSSDVIFHDPEEPTRIYKVMKLENGDSTRRIVRDEVKKMLPADESGDGERKVRVQRGVKDRFAFGLSRSRKYLDQMQRILREMDVPVELAYLPLIESSFEVRAHSRAGAVGMWQFIRSTGRRYLHISPTIDERRDPLESTRAAAKLLRENFEIFGNWPLAITAYNHGREGMLRAVAEVGSKDLVEIIRQYRGPVFGFASKSFYAEFLAALEVAKRQDDFFPDLEIHPPFPLGELELRRAVSLPALLKPTGITLDEFLEWNPALSRKVRDLPKGYRVKMPAEKFPVFLTAYRQLDGRPAAKDKTQTRAHGGSSWIVHRVAHGESLSQIARTYRTTVNKIQKANDLSNAELIFVGQHLKIPKP